METYLPKGVWLHIKSFLFKTHEMKQYDKLVKDFDYLCKVKNELKFPGEPYERFLYERWSLIKKLNFIDNFLLNFRKVY